MEKEGLLCPDLYYKLTRVFNKVLVSNRGVGMVTGKSDNGRDIPIVSGEHYRVCCPWCNDTRFRLYINHRWFENKFMANCFNETACTKGEAGKSRLDQLYLWLFGTSEKIALPIRKVMTSPSDTTALMEFRVPQGCVSLSSLSDGHDALAYIRGRGYDPAKLEKYLGLGWITDQGLPALKERLYIPIYQSGKLMGFQARIIKDDPTKTKQKYINPIGMRKSMLLYNLDNAINQPVLVVCEGPADVWSVGPSGVAIFGSDCSYNQLATIGKHFNGKPIAVALDADASDKADQLVVKIQQAVPRSSVIKIDMVGDEDPGSIKQELWRRLQNKLIELKIEMPNANKNWPSN